ncbi:MAG: hypothetical protein M3Y53_12915 [Thermoproteota archaeon]|nr:hypothetical protein [Thermoproteota archaeon]
MRTKAVPIGVIIILGLVLVIPNNMLVPNVAKAVTCVSSGGSTDCTSVAKPSSCTAAFNAHGSTSGNARTGAGSCSMGGAVIASGSSTADGANGQKSSCVASSGAQGGLFGFEGLGSGGSVSCAAHSP